MRAPLHRLRSSAPEEQNQRKEEQNRIAQDASTHGKLLAQLNWLINY
jgi:hypothetical protein